MDCFLIFSIRKAKLTEKDLYELNALSNGSKGQHKYLNITFAFLHVFQNLLSLPTSVFRGTAG